ncbi:helix-turn-helix domain-containing protein [Janthinobacterium sp. PSPC3-1]|uniref:helix-turn-helix domain-containing protein n=1 Tax=Janthinobacterium sp. PSPC3-1 TaxID=2804653 RepID=UPI003CF41EC4
METQRLKKISQTVGAAIASHRVRAGLTQEDVAERLGVGNEAISRLERGIVLPSIPRLSELAELFDCRMDELLLTASDRKSDQAAAMEAHLSDLSPEDRAFIVNQAHATASYLRSKDHGAQPSTSSSSNIPSTEQTKKNAKEF